MEDQTKLGDLPDKPFFKIGEVASFLGIKPYILRYWESEFQSLTPRKAGTGRHRKYLKEDIALLHSIKRLLYDEMYTIPGARKRLTELQQQGLLPRPKALEGEETVADDPLAGAEVAALEQQVELLRTRLDKATTEREEAIELARMTNGALKEVDAARETAENESAAMKTLLEEAKKVSPEVLQALQAELDRLRADHKTLSLERDSLEDALHKMSQEDGEPSNTQVLEGDSSVALQELRNKLRYQVSSHQRLLRQLRSQAETMMGLVKL